MRHWQSWALSGLAVAGCESASSPDPGPPGTPPVVASAPLAAVTGGQLAVTADGRVAVAGDPDGHQIFVVDLATSTVRGVVAVPDAEPGRVVVNPTDAWVALRTGGVVHLDLASATEVGRFPACATPRGLALAGEVLHVACADGELLTLNAADGALQARVLLEPDLRDVVVGEGDRLLVSTFRRAEVLVVEGGAVVDRWRPRTLAADQGAQVPSAPGVAWRTIALPGGGLAMLHQRAQLSRVITQIEGGYGAGDGQCSPSIVAPTVTVFGPEGTIEEDGVLPNSVLAVDLAADPRPDGGWFVAAAGQVEGGLQSVVPQGTLGACLFPTTAQVTGAVTTSVAVDGQGVGWGLIEAPLALVRLADAFRIELDPGRFDTGHQLFHQDAGSGIACASCHPEGGDDGQTWLFEDVGLRRTQNLRGGLKHRAPFHWEGDLPTFGALVEEVMVKRMGGPHLTAAHTDRLLTWIDTLPVIRMESLEISGGDSDAITRGRALYEGPEQGCVGCHLADGQGDQHTYDVGTGGFFKVPTLAGLAARAPYLHDGCAATLADRFGPCGGGDQHGKTNHLAPEAVADLVSFLKTL